MSEKSRLLKNTGLIALGNFGAKITSFLLLPLYTSILATEEYGNYDFIVAVSAFLMPVMTLCLHEAMFRFIIESGNKGEEFEIIISNALLTILASVAFLGLPLFVIDGFIRPIEYWQYIWIYVAASSLYTFSNNLLRGMGRIKEYAIISSGKNILQLVVNVVVIVVFRWGLEGLLFSMCVTEVLAFVIVSINNRLWEHVNQKLVSKNKLIEMLKYSLPLIPNALSAQIINLSDRLMIKGMMGASQNGIYSVSYKFPNIIETVYHYFYTAWSESASRVLNTGKDKANEYYQFFYETVDNLIFSVVLLMVSGMPILFRIFVRGDYVAGFTYIPMLMFAMYFNSMGKLYSGMFTAIKKTSIMATTTLIGALINIGINIFFIPVIGLYAAAASTLAAEMVVSTMRLVNIKKFIDLKINFPMLLAKVIVALAVVAIYSYDDWKKTGISIAIACTFAVVTNLKTLSVILNSIKKKIKR